MLNFPSVTTTTKMLSNCHKILNITLECIQIQWIAESPLLSEPPKNLHSAPRKAESSLRMETAVADMLSKGAVTKITDGSPGFYSRLFMVPKKGSDKWRPIIDLSALNKFTIFPKFKMETAESIRASLAVNEWVTSVDLTDAYFHCLL